jgi:RimJ/RimL family protein N-acetyltransferase
MTAGIDTLWPLFGLRIRTERLVLRPPTDDDLAALVEVARAGIHPPDEMPFGTAWTAAPSPAFEYGFLQHFWGSRANWSPDAWMLNLMVERDGEPMGGQSIGADGFAVMRTVATGSWLGLPFQGKGYGREMREAVLAFAFDTLGASVATSEAFLDNAASGGVSRSLGYEENGRGSLAPQGVARETQRYRMTVDGWRGRERGRVDLEGFDACRTLFGVEDAGAGAGQGR